MRKHGDIQLAKTERKRNYLVTEPNYHNTKFFTEYLLAKEIKKTQILMNKAVYLGSSILELSKILIYEIWYDYVKRKYGKKGYKMFGCIHEIDYIYQDIVEDVETRFDTLNHELDRPLPKESNWINESDGKIMIKFVGLRAKTYSSLIDDSSADNSYVI